MSESSYSFNNVTFYEFNKCEIYEEGKCFIENGKCVQKDAIWNMMNVS